MRPILHILYVSLMLTLVLLFGCEGCSDLGSPDNPDCGDGVRNGQEVCDGRDLNGQTCQSQGFRGGTLHCALGCAGFVVAECTGVLQPAEETCGYCDAHETCQDGACVAICDGEPILMSSTRDYDLSVVRLRGAVTRDGAEMAPAQQPGDRGFLVFYGDVWWDGYRVDLPSEGAAALDVPIYPGTYRVWWRTERWAQAGGVLLDEAFVVDADTSMSFDLPPLVEVSGVVTVNGRPVHEHAWFRQFAGRRSRILFVPHDQTLGSTAVKLSDSGPAHYTTRLYPGGYDLYVAHEGAENQPGTIERFAELSVEPGQTDYDLDIPVARISGTLTLNGQPLVTSGVDASASLYLWKADETERRRVSFANYVEVARYTQRFEPGDDPSFELYAIAGRYDVWLAAQSPQLTGHAPLRVGAELDAGDMSLDLDVEVERVTGTVLRNGGRVPNSARDGTSRGEVVFRGRDGSEFRVALGERGPAEFEIWLPRQTYDVRVRGNSWSFALPFVPYTARKGWTLDGEAELELDVPAVHVRGELTLNGQPMPVETQAEFRGGLELRASGSDEARLWHTYPIPAQGPARYDLILSPGSYDVNVSRWWLPDGRRDRAPNYVLPTSTTYDLGQLEVREAMLRDFDLRIVTLEGEVLLDGDALPDGAGARGVLQFIDARTDHVARTFELGASGPATYEVSLYPGIYVVTFLPAREFEAVPFEPVVLEQALRVDDAMRHDLRVVDVTLRGVVTINGAPSSASGPLGTLGFARTPTAFDATVDVPVEPEGRFEARLFGGHYNVLFKADEAREGLPDHTILLEQSCQTGAY